MSPSLGLMNVGRCNAQSKTPKQANQVLMDKNPLLSFLPDINVLHLAERLKLPSKAGDLLAPSPLGAGKAEFVRPPRVSEELQKSFSTEEHVLNDEQLVFGDELTSRRGSPLALPEILEGLDFPLSPVGIGAAGPHHIQTAFPEGDRKSTCRAAICNHTRL